jgi:pimeloyl-ACP methyl ester carboxylesterase
MFKSLRDTVPVVAVWALLLPSALAAVLPQYDPFYTAPAGYENEAPGTILRTRRVATAYLGLIPNLVEAWQLLYRTTAINGTAISTATTVFKPIGAMTDRFVSFQTAYDGSAETGACDPSYNYQLFAPQIDLISSVEFFLLQAYILKGYIVSSPDYEGPDAAFSAGRLAGMGVLDSMRAVVNFKDTLGLSTSNPSIVGYGYSGGGIATGWAASLLQNYATELNVKGWASGGTPANVTGTALLVDGTVFAGFLPQALVGLNADSAYHAELNPVLERIATTYGKQQLDIAQQICSVQNLLTFAFGQVQSTKFQTLGDQVFYEPTLSNILSRNTMGINADETPKVPVYLYHATNDEVIPYTNATTLYSDWCADGASVQFVTVANGGHATTEIIGFVGAYEFVDAAFAGTTAKGCSMSTILDETINPLALGLQLEPVIVGLLNALVVAGRKDVNIINDIETMNTTITA